uniref:Uncharacterized protein n=1 Tax=Panagrolaimus sp. PS1159 TaxID=55785 RepID=A0AC35G8V3_9BILA
FKTSEAYGKHICSTKQLFYEKNNFFVNDFLVLKVKGIFKILLPSGIKYPLSAKWNIKESELDALKTSTNGCLKSKRFSISSDSDIKYFLTIYPNGNKEENRGAAWIFLHLNFESETSVNAIFSFLIKSASFSVDCQNLYSKSSGWGSFICLTKDLFNRPCP